MLNVIEPMSVIIPIRNAVPHLPKRLPSLFAKECVKVQETEGFSNPELMKTL